MSYKKSVLLFCFFGLITTAYGQFDTAEVLGTVRDSSGSVVPKAAIVLTNQDTAVAVRSTTDDNGNYTFFDVKPGRYQLTAEMTGFAKFTARDIAVDVNARQRVDVALKVGDVSQAVEVVGVASVLDTDSSEK